MKAFNKIMSTLRKVVTKLDKLEDMNIKVKIYNDELANEYKEESDNLMTEARLARDTADKLRKFYEID
jgi:hypothetical protein